MSEQLTLDFENFDRPQPEAIYEATAVVEISPVRMSRLRTTLGEKAAAQTMDEKPHYELGGGVAEAIEAQEQDGLTPFAEFLENYQPHKREVAALFEQFRFHDLNERSLSALPTEQKGRLSVYIIEHIDHMHRRGRVLKTDGAFGGPVAESYNFTDEAASRAYGEELIALAETTASQPVFLQLKDIAQTFLDDWHQQRNNQRVYPATDLTRRQFIQVDKVHNGQPQVVAVNDNGHIGLRLAYPERLAA